MSWHVTEDVEQFLAAAGDLMYPEPGLHTVALTVCENVRARSDGTRFAWYQEASGEVTGAASETPGYPLVLGVVPEDSIPALVEIIRPFGVNGPTQLAVQVAAAAAKATGQTATLLHAERLFRLVELAPPEVPGTSRIADERDADLIVSWFTAFITEAGVLPQAVEKTVADRISYSGMVLWEDDGPVALAGHTRTAFGGARIGPVYTPPEHRNHGYGAAVTAAASRRVLERGAWEVVLFTDLTNPVSNRLYPRLGFEPVTDRAVLTLG